MTNRTYGALIASLSVVTLMLATNDASARTGTAHRGGFATAHARFHPFSAQSSRHRRQNDFGVFWPDDDYYGGYGGASTGGPTAEGTAPASGDIHYTQTYDVPWDWAHRYPPSVLPSDRPYVPSCAAEIVKVPGRDGSDQTVNVTRCY